MVSKFLLVSILDLLLGINFLSPVVFVYNSLGSSPAAQVDQKTQNAPFLLPSAETGYFPIRDWGISDPDVAVHSAIVYDSASDKILFEKYSELKLPIASLTKLMTAVAIFENMDFNREKIAESAARFSEDRFKREFTNIVRQSGYDTNIS